MPAQGEIAASHPVRRCGYPECGRAVQGSAQKMGRTCLCLLLNDPRDGPDLQVDPNGGYRGTEAGLELDDCPQRPRAVAAVKKKWLAW